jgi:hypothetical protein
MKTLSGYLLSKVSYALAEVNAGQLSLQELSSLLAELVVNENSQVELADDLVNKLTLSKDVHTGSRLKYLSTDDLSRLNVLLPWSSYNSVGQNVPLGSAYLAHKRSAPHNIPDAHLKTISQHINISNFSALEIGCFEGHYTASLASYCKTVNAVDSRIENVIKTLVRLWVLKLDGKANIDVFDLDSGSLADFYKSQNSKFKGFDLVHHRGVLYHLEDPCKHLADLAVLGMSHIYLHTQYAHPSQPLAEYKSVLGSFNAFYYNEKNIGFAPFAGMRKHAIWLQKTDIFNILKGFGMSKIEVISDKAERNGSRIELIASR